MKKLLLLILLVAAGIGIWFLSQHKVKQVSVIHPERGRIEAVIRVTGKVINDRTVKMTALADGQITRMPVRLGDSVEAGQVLTVLDKREADARLRKAEAENAREQQAVAESTRTLKRLTSVLSSGGATKQSVEDARAQLRAAEARLKVTTATVDIEKIHREKIELRAPFAGVITQKTTEVGQWLEAGSPLFTLVAHEGREIEANVDAGDTGVIEQGQTVSLVSDAWPDRPWPETIVRIAPAIAEDQEEALNAVSVRISLGPDAPPLLLGQQVDARIQTATRENVLTLPFEALIESDSGSRVAIVRAGKIAFIPIKTGLEDFTQIEIMEGLSEKDQVISPFSEEFVEGEEIEIIPQDN